MIVDYSYYSMVWAGVDIPASDFDQISSKAERFVKTLLLGKKYDIDDDIKNAICAAADALYKVYRLNKNVPAGVKSESVDGVSVTYQDTEATTTEKQEQSLMYSAVKAQLAHTGIMYRGVESIC